MKNFIPILSPPVAAAWLIASLFVQPICAEERSAPSLGEIQREVERHFAKLPDYQPGDIITLQDAEPLLERLVEMGWSNPDVESVSDSFLSETAAVVRELRTATGRTFMRRVSKLPSIYDRLERVTWLRDGASLLAQIAADPQGEAIARQLVNPVLSSKFSELAAGDPKGANFSLPTGRIHTVADLLAELKRTSEEGELRRKEANAKLK